MRVAVVGSGISGLTAAWLLRSQHEVHLFEREACLGGHACAFEVERTEQTLALDLGFLVHSQATHPNLVRLFDILGVQTQPCDASCTLHCAGCGLEYGGSALQEILTQPTSAWRPSFLRLLADIKRFGATGWRLVASGLDTGQTLDELMLTGGYSPDFRRHFLAPMSASGGVSVPDDLGRFPVFALVQLLSGRGLLGPSSHVEWRAVTGGSRSYVQAVELGLGDRVHTSTPVARVERDEREVRLAFADGGHDTFDLVIMATHADEALALLAEPSDHERALLGSWEYSRHEAVLHSDLRLLPRRRAARTTWAYRIADCERPSERVSVSCYLNRLLALDIPEPYVVTVDPGEPPPAEKVVHRTSLTRPVFTPASLATRDVLVSLGGANRTYYCGAHLGWGSHEDGLVSALQVAERLGVRWW